LRFTSTACADLNVNVTQVSSIQEENQPSGALTARIKPYRGQLRNEFLARARRSHLSRPARTHEANGAQPSGLVITHIYLSLASGILIGKKLSLLTLGSNGRDRFLNR
jgi:hypothetical protein